MSKPQETAMRLRWWCRFLCRLLFGGYGVGIGGGVGIGNGGNGDGEPELFIVLNNVRSGNNNKSRKTDR